MKRTLGIVAKLLIGIALFAGLPLVGWGVLDIAGFFANRARLAYFLSVVLLQLFIVLKFPAIGRTGGDGTKLIPRQRVAVLLLQVLSLAILLVAPFCDHRAVAVLDVPELVRYVGLALFIPGFFLMNWSEATLGELFSVQVTIQTGHRLVTNGPYRHVRHPRYASLLLYNLGVALVFRSWLALILVAALTLVLLWRIADEESLMRQEFGAEWDAYTARSWRIVPYLY
jgi:protein-S-isoprenylcysteine O-methyltransferase Ste14